MDIRRSLQALPGISTILVPQCVLNELEGLSTKLPDARTGLRLATMFGVAESEGHGDDCVLETARKLGAMVLTNDREFIRRLKNAGIPVLSIRGGRSIDFV